jgi:heterodisulfide reductase subunit A2
MKSTVLENDPKNNNKLGSVMVVGGGVAGMQAALDLAEQGFFVYLIERSPSIGGRMSMLDKTFPTNDCAMCMISPKLVEVGRHNNIEVLTLANLTELTGEPGRFTAKVRIEPRYVDPAKCVGCGLCAEKCPKKVPDEFNQRLSTRKAIYIPYPQSVPLIYSIDRNHCIYFAKGKCRACEKFCQSKAIDFDQKEEVRSLKVGAVILAPGFDLVPGNIRPELGYGRYPNVISSLEFERILSASGPYTGHVKRPSDQLEPKKIAWIQCVGSRDKSLGRGFCSSVCCMYATKEAMLAREHISGLETAVFYLDIRAQGKGFDAYYERAAAQGVRYIPSMISRVAQDPRTKNLRLSYIDPTSNQIKEEEFDLVVLSLGMTPSAGTKELAARLNLKINADGFALTEPTNPLATSRPGVFTCGVFQSPKDIPETVSQASAAAAEASALLAPGRGTLVHPIEIPDEKDVADQEPRVGIFICHCGINIAGVLDVPELVKYAQSLPHVVHAQNYLYACSTDSQDHLKKMIDEHHLNRVIIASCSPRTHEPLFQATVAQAGLNKYLFEMANIRDQCAWVHGSEPEKATAKAKDLIHMSLSRALALRPLSESTLSVKPRGLVLGGGIAGMVSALSLADQGFETVLVEKEEALGGQALLLYRTLEGLEVQPYLEDLIRKVETHPGIVVRTGCEPIDLGGYVGNFKVTLHSNKSEWVEDCGAVIMATGGREYSPTEYLYGQDPRVLTQRELETALTEKKERVQKAKTIVMIQCVGSRNEKNPSCSRICCGQAVKNALRLKEQNPQVRIVILYRDIRTFGFKEYYYQQAREAGVLFIRFYPENPPQVEARGDLLSVQVREPALDRIVELKADLLILSAGVRPHPDTKQLSSLFKLPRTAEGFFLEAHVKLRPLDFANAGFFLAGLAHGPKYIEESIAQAKAAAARAGTLLAKSTIKLSGSKAIVDKTKCSVCLTCVRACPFNVPIINTGHAEINPALCQGCGVCVSECPAKAISLQHSTDEQLRAKIEALAA